MEVTANELTTIGECWGDLLRFMTGFVDLRGDGDARNGFLENTGLIDWWALSRTKTKLMSELIAMSF